MKEKIKSIQDAIDHKFYQQFHFHVRDTNLRKIANYMYKPKDASSLAVTRILFGIAMLFDIAEERGGAVMVERWGNPSTCHFPLLASLEPLPMPHMAVMYSGLWLGALGIALGYKFRLSGVTFCVSYWYLLLVDKSYWNNHSYLFGLVAILLTFTQANCLWSFDAILEPSISSETVPYWNYFVLKYQFFILYFVAGVKKGTAEWLSGYSVLNLSEHWVFNPIKLFLTVPQTDYLVVHWFVFVFDLTVAFWMMWARSRHAAVAVCALFHLMNSRLFRIGMFPWVCLATMPLFYPFHWPKLVIAYLEYVYSKSKSRICRWINMFKNGKFTKGDSINIKKNRAADKTAEEPRGGITGDLGDHNETENKENQVPDKSNDDKNIYDKDNDDKNDDDKDNDDQNNDTKYYDNNTTEVSKHKSIEEGGVHERQKICTCILISFYLITQAFLPFSHFITKGYNNWTNGLYGYSWDMMVHTWDLHSVVVKVVDNENNNELFIDPYHFTGNDRWTRHGDMVHQFARCLKDNVPKKKNICECDPSEKYLSENISIYFDVWSSLNGRFTQRMFDPRVDMLNVSWSPFSPVSYLMPIIDDGLHWRERLLSLRETVHSWSNVSDVIFIADFPGYEYERYIPAELSNVTLTILDGMVVYEPEVSAESIGKSYQLQTGDTMKLPSGIFHKVTSTGSKPAFYMFMFYNNTAIDVDDHTPPPKLPLSAELGRRFRNMARFAKNLLASFYRLFFNLTKCQ